MSYKYGLNGNDLNWDAMMFLESFVEEFEISIFNKEVELNEDGEVEDGVYESFMDGNPTIVYYKGETLDIQKILKDDKQLEDYLEWYIAHDTNGNFVYFQGDVPDEYLTEEYIKERDEEEGMLG